MNELWSTCSEAHQCWEIGTNHSPWRSVDRIQHKLMPDCKLQEKPCIRIGLILEEYGGNTNELHTAWVQRKHWDRQQMKSCADSRRRWLGTGVTKHRKNFQYSQSSFGTARMDRETLEDQQVEQQEEPREVEELQKKEINEIES